LLREEEAEGTCAAEGGGGVGRGRSSSSGSSASEAGASSSDLILASSSSTYLVSEKRRNRKRSVPAVSHSFGKSRALQGRGEEQPGDLLHGDPSRRRRIFALARVISFTYRTRLQPITLWIEPKEGERKISESRLGVSPMSEGGFKDRPWISVDGTQLDVQARGDLTQPPSLHESKTRRERGREGRTASSLDSFPLLLMIVVVVVVGRLGQSRLRLHPRLPHLLRARLGRTRSRSSIPTVARRHASVRRSRWRGSG
jgi:hypothetical protein